MRSKEDYERVFQPSTKGRGRRRVPAPGAVAGRGDDVVAFVEDQVRAITAAVRLMAGPQPQDLPEEQREEQREQQRAIAPRDCPTCLNSNEPHLHGAKLYARGEEKF